MVSQLNSKVYLMKNKRGNRTYFSHCNKHLEMGRELLSRGQLQDALSHYHLAVGKLLQKKICGNYREPFIF